MTEVTEYEATSTNVCTECGCQYEVVRKDASGLYIRCSDCGNEKG